MPLAKKVVHTQYEDNFVHRTIPDGCWDFRFLKRQGTIYVFITGARTHPFEIPYQKNDEMLSIEFKPYAFLPGLPAIELLDSKTFLLHEKSSFFLGEKRFGIPTFENAESLVKELTQKKAVANNPIVEAVVEGKPQEFGKRSIQRHFRQATGMTWKLYQQIKRVQHAIKLLKQGLAPLEVAFEMGYADQSHMTRSFKKIIGKTPSELMKK
jgi:hypothetical protein